MTRRTAPLIAPDHVAARIADAAFDEPQRDVIDQIGHPPLPPLSPYPFPSRRLTPGAAI